MRSASIAKVREIKPLEQRSFWGRRIIIGISGAMLIFAALAYGAVHPWAYFSMGLIMAVTSLTLIASFLNKIYVRPNETLVIPYPPLWWLGLGLVLLVLIQILPWPQWLVKWLSPRAWEIRCLGAGFGMSQYLPFSLNPAGTLLEGLKVWPAVVLFFVLIYTINTKGQLLGMVVLILAVALFESSYGFWHYQSQLIWGWKNPYSIDSNGLFGTFINHNHLATLLVMAILLGYGLFLGLKPTSVGNQANLSGWTKWSSPDYAEPKLRRFLLLFLLLVLGIGLIFTRSRGGMLSLAFGFFLMALLTLGRRWQKGHLFIIVFFLLSALLFSLIRGSSNLVLNWFGHYDYARYEIFKAALALFRNFPWLGSGIGTFGDLLFPYQSGEMPYYYYVYAHSDWLQLLVESGLAGFVLLGAGWLIFFTSLVQQWGQRRDTFARGLGLGGIAALGAGAFHALVDFPFHIPAIAFLYAGIAAITYLTLFYRIPEGVSCLLANVHIPVDHRKMTIAVISGLIVVIQLAVGVQVCYAWLAERAAPMEINSTRAAPRLTVEDFRRALAFEPMNSKYYFGLAEVLKRRGADDRTLGEVEKSFQAAICYAPANWGYHYKLADFYLGHWWKAPNRYLWIALKEFAAAIILFPHSGPLHFQIASTLAWAEQYYPASIPTELRGRQSYYLDQALKLDPGLAQYLKVK